MRTRAQEALDVLAHCIAIKDCCVSGADGDDGAAALAIITLISALSSFDSSEPFVFFFELSSSALEAASFTRTNSSSSLRISRVCSLLEIDADSFKRRTADPPE